MSLQIDNRLIFIQPAIPNNLWYQLRPHSELQSD
jgi:hypothetical protein